jgi:hypothetical protein
LSLFPKVQKIFSRDGLGADFINAFVCLMAFSCHSARPCAAQYLPSVSGTVPSPVDIPQTNLTPITQPAFGGFPATPNPPFSAPAPFDPYSTGANPGTFSPAVQGLPPVSPSQFPGWLPSANSAQGPGLFGGMFSGTPASGTPTFGAGNPGFGPPSYETSPYGASAYGAPSFPPEAYPAGSPNTLFPGGLFSGGSFAGASGAAYSSNRFFQGPRIRYAWLYDGNGPNDLQMQDIDTSLVFAFQNFLYSGQPIFIVPSFGLHLLDGPDGANAGRSDLPGQLYDAFIDAGWQSDPTQLLGADIGLRVGVFSDFESTSDDSIRVLGKGLVHFRLTPYSTLKAGIFVLDRNEVNVIPAGGLLYQPTPFTRFDLFFPQPKLSQYCRTIGTQDVWGYIAGDYGGGAWTIERANGDVDGVDINDFRVLAGFEWGRSDLIRTGRHTGFFEVGYVFEREVLYNSHTSANPQNFEPGNTIMLRFGLGY